LALLLDTELAFGRDRRAHDHTAGVSPARTLDLDLIAVGDLRCQTADLTLPHPRATQRAFVLEPLAELLPSFGLRDARGDQASVATWLSRLSSSDREQLHPVE
ncbi:MAG: 2-amino-4-hydroxy-6-hydroxymethyldihydropteridine diphosphokinase, partial [Burkholderiaceae bacterium]